MLQVLRREAIYLWYYLSVQVELILPYWLLGILLGSVISVFGKGRIHAAFSSMRRRKWGALGLIPASLLGIAPVYVRNDPVGSRLLPAGRAG